MKYGKLLKGGLELAGAAALVAVSMGAFSRPSRREIRERAGRRSELSGRYDLPLDASHIIHSRQFPAYDHPENGIYLTIEEHLIYHEIFRPKPWLIGLSPRNNEMAIRSLRNRLDMALRKNNVQPLTPEGIIQVEDLLAELVADHCKRLDIANPFDQLLGM